MSRTMIWDHSKAPTNRKYREENKN